MVDSPLVPFLSQEICGSRCNEAGGQALMRWSEGMDRLSNYAKRPVAFLLRYVRRRKIAHAAILTAVISAVGCSVSSQYGVKFLVDTLSAGPHGAAVWLAFAVLVSGMVRTTTAAYAAGRAADVDAGWVVAPDRAPGLSDAAVAFADPRVRE